MIMLDECRIQLARESRFSTVLHAALLGGIAAVCAPYVPPKAWIYIIAFNSLTREGVQMTWRSVRGLFSRAAGNSTRRGKKRAGNPIPGPYEPEKSKIKWVVKSCADKLKMKEAPKVLFYEDCLPCGRKVGNAGKITVSASRFADFREKELWFALGRETGRVAMDPKGWVSSSMESLRDLAAFTAMGAGINSVIAGDLFSPAVFGALMISSWALWFRFERKQERLGDSYGVMLSGDIDASLSSLQKLDRKPGDILPESSLEKAFRRLEEFQDKVWWLIGPHTPVNARTRSMRRTARRFGLEA